MTDIIELFNVTKIFYCGAETIHAVNDLSLSVNQGEILAVVGPSGAGKTTLLNLMGCLDQPASGQVRIEGKDVSRMSDAMLARIRQEKIGFVFQRFFLLPTLTALENVLLPCVFHHGVSSNEKKRAMSLLETVGLKSRRDHLPAALSGGEMQRVAVARSLILNPKILIADEPTGNLDSANTRIIVDLLKQLNRQGLTVIHVTHNRSIGQNAHRVIYLRDGSIIREAKRGVKAHLSFPSPGLGMRTEVKL